MSRSQLFQNISIQLSGLSASGSVGHPGHHTADDVLTAINNIRRGNHPPLHHALSHNNNCTYCSGTGHWQSNCPVLRRDTFLPPPQESDHALTSSNHSLSHTNSFSRST
ncbi:hypothetical protein VP01_2331g4 [Puccinia sorghi]|uniref:CCHC-type domain-containing protein n=1 Tax=Puccinia sorghi TaxID=27349 RepID=A0A0L6V9D1_9BASI|nr:hypothetical protein VP01_2331g4 [Puccinia sorghi]